MDEFTRKKLALDTKNKLTASKKSREVLIDDLSSIYSMLIYTDEKYKNLLIKYQELLSATKENHERVNSNTKDLREIHQNDIIIIRDWIKNRKNSLTKRRGERKDENEPMRESIREWINKNHKNYKHINTMAEDIEKAKLEPVEYSTLNRWANLYVTEVGLKWLDKSSLNHLNEDDQKTALVNAKIAPIDRRKAGYIIKTWREKKD